VEYIEIKCSFCRYIFRWSKGKNWDEFVLGGADDKNSVDCIVRCPSCKENSKIWFVPKVSEKEKVLDAIENKGIIGYLFQVFQKKLDWMK